jgi:hypothetical protein
MIVAGAPGVTQRVTNIYIMDEHCNLESAAIENLFMFKISNIKVI